MTLYIFHDLVVSKQLYILYVIVSGRTYFYIIFVPGNITVKEVRLLAATFKTLYVTRFFYLTAVYYIFYLLLLCFIHETHAPFRKISNSAQCGKFALILWRLVKRSIFCVF